MLTHQTEAYLLRVTLDSGSVCLHLKVFYQPEHQDYFSTFSLQQLPTLLKESTNDIQQVLQLLKKTNNFEIDIVSGAVVVKLRSIRDNEFEENKIELKLREVGQNSNEVQVLFGKEKVNQQYRFSPSEKSSLACSQKFTSRSFTETFDTRRSYGSQEQDEEKIREIVREVFILERDALESSGKKQISKKIRFLEGQLQKAEKQILHLEKMVVLFVALISIAIFWACFPFVRFSNSGIKKAQRHEQDKETEAMKLFGEKMEAWKEEFHDRMQLAEKIDMKWEFQDNNDLVSKGEYKGEVEKGKPHGVGRFMSQNGRWKVEGEWEDGKLHGKAIKYYSNGEKVEYEIKDGKNNGRFVWHKKDGSRISIGWLKGLWHGKRRVYHSDGSMSEEEFRHGKQV